MPTTPHQHDSQAGTSAIELVLLTPLLILIVFGIIQAALLWHAQQVTTAAAQQGARFARAETGAAPDPGMVRAETINYVHQLGADLVADPTVTVAGAAGWVTVTVTGHAVSLIPGGTLSVHAVSRGPVEEFRP